MIHKELGESNYRKYFYYVKRSVETKSADSQALFNDMYDKLKYRDIKSIAKMHHRLNDTMLLAFRISRNFMIAFMVYMAATIFILTRGLEARFLIPAMVIITGAFLYKVYEFVANKFCYIDAQIVLVYKAVIDRLLINESRGSRIK